MVIEASTDSEWVARCLEAFGHEVIVADPNFAPMYATRARKVKTDRRDARALAEACLLGAYRPAHRLSDPQGHVRGRLLVRDAVVRTRTRYISLIRALLRQHGYRVPSGSAESFIHRVRGLPLPGRLLSVVAPLLALMRPLNRQPSYSDATIEHLAVQDPRVPRLRSVPSIGPVTAAAFHRRDRRRPTLPPRASARSLPRPRAPRVQLGRDPAPGRDHQGRPLAHPRALDSEHRQH
jgi:transposase